MAAGRRFDISLGWGQGTPRAGLTRILGGLHRSLVDAGRRTSASGRHPDSCPRHLGESQPRGIQNSSAVPHPARAGHVVGPPRRSSPVLWGTTIATSQDFVTWTCGDRLDNRFLLWALRGERAQILSRMQGSTQDDLHARPRGPADLAAAAGRAAGDRRLPRRRDPRIDALITKKRQLIHLLEERRRQG